MLSNIDKSLYLLSKQYELPQSIFTAKITIERNYEGKKDFRNHPLLHDTFIMPAKPATTSRKWELSAYDTHTGRPATLCQIFRSHRR